MKRLGPYVIPGRDPQRPRSDLKRPWNKVKEKANIPDVRIHDVRRTYGLAVARRAGLHVAQKALRHSDIRVTERVYAPLGLDDLRESLEKVKPGTVVDIEKKAAGSK
jgi:integrase